jgi:hypothetical protein
MDVNSLWLLLPIGLIVVYIMTLNRKKSVPVILVETPIPALESAPITIPQIQTRPYVDTWNWDIKGPPAPSRRPPVETSGMDVLTPLPDYTKYSYPDYWKTYASPQWFYDIPRVGPIAKPWVSGTDGTLCAIRF